MPNYPPLPVMQCDTNCGECCGVVPCTDAEFSAIAEFSKLRGIKPTKQGLTCPWYQGGCCVVHEVRPALCRLFGHVPSMQCSKGYNVNIGQGLVRKWDKKIVGATRLLHEVIEGWSIDNELKKLQR